MFSCEFYEISKKTFFTEDLWATAFKRLETMDSRLQYITNKMTGLSNEAEICIQTTISHVIFLETFSIFYIESYHHQWKKTKILRYKHTTWITLKRRGNDRFHVVSTWNPLGVFVGYQ